MEVLEGFLIPDRDFPDQGEEDEGGADWETDEPIPDPKEPLTLQTLYAFDYGAVPEGETPIIPMDLSLSEFGDAYINNATGLKPDTKKLLSMNLKDVPTLLSVNRGADPLVLILHTHGTEGYSENGAISFLDRGEDLARSSDPSQNVLAVGQVLAETLNRAGVNTLHCTVMHDQPQYKDSYRRSEETIRRYLKEYPSIRLVIDLHRDSVLKSGGELVRPVTLVDGEPTAQMMCVIGSNWNGGSYPNWEKNLALALKLRAEMNREGENICRPVYLKGSTYNQELAPYSLLVEMGASGNSLEEAKRAAEKFAMALITIAPAL
ncbi:MAG: stage II sporulation protein P [Clostridia bacterium]|nr:stage II sporulation protein P [Clostridia bacterium]